MGVISSSSSPSPLGGRSLAGIFLGLLLVALAHGPSTGVHPVALPCPRPFPLLWGGVWGWICFALTFFEFFEESASTTDESSSSSSSFLGGGCFALAFLGGRLAWTTGESSLSSSSSSSGVALHFLGCWLDVRRPSSPSLSSSIFFTVTDFGMLQRGRGTARAVDLTRHQHSGGCDRMPRYTSAMDTEAAERGRR